MNRLATGISSIDLEFLGTPRVIATGVLSGPGGIALIDPGPSTSLVGLRKGLASLGATLADVTALLVTHIHLDHSGGVGTLVRDQPRLRVYVHTKGAPHLIDPGRLLASAARLYGDDMERLWGDVLPVPADTVTVVDQDARIEAGGRTLEVAYTPGHASHHVSYFVRDAGIAFVGDTAGVQVIRDGDIVPPTPPPDVDLEAWLASLARIERWGPQTLFLTHFGPTTTVGAHLGTLRDNLEAASRLVRASLSRDGRDEEREAWFVEQCRRDLVQRMPEHEARVYEVAGRFDLNWRGLARYWRQRGDL